MSPFAQNMLSGAKTSSWLAAWERHTVFLNIITLALVLVVSVVYIIQVNGSITKGYAIRELETQIKRMTLETQQLETETQKVQTLEHVNQAVKMLGFVPSENPTYLVTTPPSYALAK